MHKYCGVGGNAWTAGSSDFGQYLIIDLGQVMNITALATQGRSLQNEYVMEYRISYGTNGLDYVDFKEEDGHAKVSSLVLALAVDFVICMLPLIRWFIACSN